MAKVEGFVQRNPSDGDPATQRTEAYMAYDDDNLYIVVLAFDTDPDKIRARMARRENAFGDDFIEVTLDTFNDQRRGFLFWVNPLGIQADALWSEDNGPDFSFDTLWQSRGQLTDEGYVVWISIPFKSLRFQPGAEQDWGLVLMRNIPRNSEWSFWPHISSRIDGRLNQAAKLTGMQNISPGRNVQLIPYTNFSSFRALDTLDENNPRFIQDNTADAGLDAKIVLQDSLVLDVTLNPDFSQVESDNPQVTANQRFEVFFPEKRPFFLENASFFETPINLLFTRRIADPQFGVRLTGKKGPYALGAMFIDDQSPGRSVIETDPQFGKRAHFVVARVSRDLPNQSSLGMIYTDREFDGSYNRVGGVDSRLKFGQNWVANFQAVTSSTLDEDGEFFAGPAYSARLDRSGRQLFTRFQYDDVGENFETEPGFVSRTGIRNFWNFTRYRFRPEGDFLIAWGPNIWNSRTWDRSNTRLDWTSRTGIAFEFIGQSFFEFFYRGDRERLRPDDFDALLEPRDFGKNISGVFFNSSYFKMVSFGGNHRVGNNINFVPPEGEEPFLARQTQTTFETTLRPLTPLRIENTYILSRFRDRATGEAIFNNHIARSNWNWQFTKELSLRAILQYNSVLANPNKTKIQTQKGVNADFLITYLINPGTALFIGYNSNAQNLDPSLATFVDPAGDTQIVRPQRRFINDAHQFFVKFSYLWRF
jgi:hypothetical protein